MNIVSAAELVLSLVDQQLEMLFKHGEDSAYVQMVSDRNDKLIDRYLPWVTAEDLNESLVKGNNQRRTRPD
jgi:hypothetical protein